MIDSGKLTDILCSATVFEREEDDGGLKNRVDYRGQLKNCLGL